MGTTATAEEAEKFADEMISRSPRIDALNFILLSESGKEAFMEFLRGEYVQDNLWFFKAVEDLKKGIDPIEFAKSSNQIIAQYLTPAISTNVHISDQLKTSISAMVQGEMHDKKKKEIIDQFVLAQRPILEIMAAGAFPVFLNSKSYRRWREGEVMEIVEPLLMDPAEESKGENIMLEEWAAKNYQERLNAEIDRVREIWIAQLLSSMEDIPVCVSLASARRDMKGFPLIYVNKEFERITGYLRSDIIGQNCKFLQVGYEEGHDAETDSISRLSKALSEALPVKVVITNFRENGKPFRNMLAMKPIFDHNGEYCFVFGAQFDITEDDERNLQKLKMIDDLMKALPDVFC